MPDTTSTWLKWVSLQGTFYVRFSRKASIQALVFPFDPIVRELVQQPLMGNHAEGFAEIKEHPVNLSSGIYCLGPVIY